MIDLKTLNNNYVICPNNIKKQILDEMNECNELYNISFLSMESFYDSCTFTISNEMLYFVMNTYDTTYDIAYSYLQSLKSIYLINDINIDNEKVLFLLNLKKQLINNKLIKETNIIKYYNTKQFIIIGYDNIEKKYSFALDYINNYQIIKSQYNLDKTLEVYEFNTIEDEINYVYEQIITLLQKGININNIKITGVTNDYYFLLKKFAKMYNLPITIDNQRSLYSTSIGKEFLNKIKTNEYLKYLSVLQKNNNNYYNIIVNILNEFTFIEDLNKVYPIILKKFTSTYINELYTNDIKVVNINNLVINENEYIFVMGLNQGKIPLLQKDEEYLEDELKQSLGINTTVELNVFSKEEVINKLYNINNIYLSYSLASTFSSLLPSSIISEYHMQVIKNKKLKYNYSNIYNNYALTSKLDDFVKYGTKDNELYSLLSTYGTKLYDSYDHTFKGIDNQLLNNKLNNQVNLSYTSLDSYNKCKFKYYIDYILKLNIYEDTFYTMLGSTFHEVLSYAFSDDFDFDKQFILSKEKYFTSLSKKEEILLRKLKEELKFIINTIKIQLESINYTELLTEEEVIIEINKNCKIRFKGIIDKILYKQDEGTTYVALIDYKTGTIDPSINNTKYGLNLQLPIYVFLAKKSKLPNVSVTGFYYQTILQNEMKAENEEEYLDKKEKYLKLQGYTVDMPEGLKFDKTEENSQIIRGLKKGKEGFYKNSKVLNLFQMNQLEKLVENNIINAGNSIINGDFAINPLMIGKYNKSCEYCKYQDLCFREEIDIRKYEENKDLAFLEEVK